jgi:hypothetical protein
MRRVVVLLMVVALMMVVLVMSVAPALAQGDQRFHACFDLAPPQSWLGWPKTSRSSDKCPIP